MTYLKGVAALVNSFLKLLILGWCLSFPAWVAGESNSWEIRPGVVLTIKEQRVGGTDLRPVVGRLTGELSREKVCNGLWNQGYSRAEEIFGSVLDGKLLKAEENNRIFHFVVAMEWPFQDREMVVSGSKIFDARGRCIGMRWRSVFSTDAPGPTLIQQKLWILAVVSKGFEEWEIRLHFDPGGNMSSSYANGLHRDWVLRLAKILSRIG